MSSKFSFATSGLLQATVIALDERDGCTVKPSLEKTEIMVAPW
jgi:hypothetical protein